MISFSIFNEEGPKKGNSTPRTSFSVEGGIISTHSGLYSSETDCYIALTHWVEGKKDKKRPLCGRKFILDK